MMNRLHPGPKNEASLRVHGGNTMKTSVRAAVGQSVLLKKQSSGVVTLTLNRPAQFNAVSQQLLVELQAGLDAIALDEGPRVVVVAGAGKAFCAGHDL